LLRQAGFEALDIPLVEILPDEEGLARLRKLSPANFTGIFLSSPNGLRQMESGLLATELEGWLEKPFYLVGPKSANLVRNLGGKVAFYPEAASLDGFLNEYTPASVAHSKAAAGLLGTGLILSQRWLHPCSSSTRLDPAEFKKKNIGVENIPVYRPGPAPEAGKRLLETGRDADAVVFCSGTAVEHFFQAAPDLAARLGKPSGPLAISIGPSTTKALAEKGVEHSREAVHADNPSLVDALKAAFGGMATKALKKNLEKKA
ncbi:MAG: uroporphyrinogen-III synthase, partial [Fibrobacteria bacterium]